RQNRSARPAAPRIRRRRRVRQWYASCARPHGMQDVLPSSAGLRRRRHRALPPKTVMPMQNTSAGATAITVQPTGAGLGADISGVDLSRPLDRETFAAIEKAWLDHIVLRFR